MLFRISVLVGLSVGVAACNQNAPAGRLMEKTLSDGSYYEDLADSDGKYRTITRCWTKDCFQFSFTGSQINQIERSTRSHKQFAPQAGYGCRFTALNHNEIAAMTEFVKNREGEILISNEVLLRDAEKLAVPTFWSDEYVNEYAQSNLGGDASKWFDCYKVFKVLKQGSPATLETTSFSYRLIAG